MADPERSEPAAAFRRPAAGVHPPLLHPPYGSTARRAPRLERLPLRQTLTETTGPRCPEASRAIADLTRDGPGTALGERIVVRGRVVDEDGRPVRRTLLELWQANAAGRYAHDLDRHDAPLDPAFRGRGAVFTDDEGRYRFTTIRPGAYPWRNHDNAWRPAHIHFSVFGPAFATRLITQMYFPGDPLLGADPIFTSIPDPAARERLISRFDWDATVPEHALGYRFDLVLAGRAATPMENRP